MLVLEGKEVGEAYKPRGKNCEMPPRIMITATTMLTIRLFGRRETGQLGCALLSDRYGKIERQRGAAARAAGKRMATTAKLRRELVRARV